MSRSTIAFIALWLLIAWSIHQIGLGRDDTDPPGERSGLRLFTDHLTGCQYLSAGLSGITPRLNREGRHVGCEQ